MKKLCYFKASKKNEQYTGYAKYTVRRTNKKRVLTNKSYNHVVNSTKIKNKRNVLCKKSVIKSKKKRNEDFSLSKLLLMFLLLMLLGFDVKKQILAIAHKTPMYIISRGMKQTSGIAIKEGKNAITGGVSIIPSQTMLTAKTNKETPASNNTVSQRSVSKNTVLEKTPEISPLSQKPEVVAATNFLQQQKEADLESLTKGLGTVTINKNFSRDIVETNKPYLTKGITDIINEATPEAKKILTTGLLGVKKESSTRNHEGVGDLPTFKEHYSNSLASLLTLKAYPENLAAVTIIHSYGKFWPNLNIQTWQTIVVALKEQKIIKNKLNVLAYVKNPGKYQKELTEILTKNPNNLEEILALAKQPIRIDFKYCGNAFKKEIKKFIEKNYKITNNTDNKNPDVILLYKDRAILVDIKRLSNNFTGIKYDEIHAIPKQATKPKLNFLLDLLESKLTQITETTEQKQAFLDEILKLKQEINTLDPENVIEKYNNLIFDNIELLENYNINLTFVSVVDLTTFNNIPVEILETQEKNYKLAQENPIIKQIDQAVKKAEEDTNEKAFTHNHKGTITKLINDVFSNNND